MGFRGVCAETGSWAKIGAGKKRLGGVDLGTELSKRHIRGWIGKRRGDGWSGFWPADPQRYQPRCRRCRTAGGVHRRNERSEAKRDIDAFLDNADRLVAQADVDHNVGMAVLEREDQPTDMLADSSMKLKRRACRSASWWRRRSTWRREAGLPCRGISPRMREFVCGKRHPHPPGCRRHAAFGPIRRRFELDHGVIARGRARPPWRRGCRTPRAAVQEMRIVPAGARRVSRASSFACSIRRRIWMQFA